MTTNISRRSIAKGAAWSVPAVAVASAAPAMAASPVTYPACVTPVGLGNTTGLKSWTAYSGTKSADTATWGGSSDIGMGTMWSINMGQFQFTQPTFAGGNATGYKMEIGPTAIVRTAAGKSGSADITTNGTTTAQVIGAGLQQVISVQSTIPYKLVAKKAENYLQSISIPFCLTYLNGLQPINHTDTNTAPCCYYINYCFPASKDGSGNYPDSGGVGQSGQQYSFSVAPLDACA